LLGWEGAGTNIIGFLKPLKIKRLRILNFYSLEGLAPSTRGEGWFLVTPTLPKTPCKSQLLPYITRTLSLSKRALPTTSHASQTELQTPFVSTGSTNKTGSTNTTETTNTTGSKSQTLLVAHLPAGVYYYVVSSSIVSGDTDNGNKWGHPQQRERQRGAGKG